MNTGILVGEQARPTAPRTKPLDQRIRRWGVALTALSVVVWAAGAAVGLTASLAILTGLGFLAAAVGLRFPPIGLLGIGMLCALEPLMTVYLFTGGLLRWNTFNYWLLLTVVLFPSWALIRGDLQVALFFAAVLLLALELLPSPDWIGGAQDVLALAAGFGLLVYFRRAIAYPEAWFWMGILTGAVSAGGGMLFFAQEAQLPVINPNALAFLPVTALFAACLSMPLVALRGRGQVSLALLSGFNLAWIFLTGSRGSMLVGTVCSLFLVLSVRGLGPRAIATTLVALLTVGSIAQFPKLREMALGRVGLITSPTESLLTRTSGRSDLALAGWYMFTNHPLGVGTGGFATKLYSLDHQRGVADWATGHRKPAHSGWVKLLAENGAPGFVLLGGFVVSFLITGWRSGSRSLFLLCALTTTSLSLGFLSTEYQSKGLWFLAAGTIALLGSQRYRTWVSGRGT
jgi:O-Antigen ligase